MLLAQMAKDLLPYAASVLQEAGYKVGLYTSHLKDFRERIKINGTDITENFVCDFINDNKSFFSIE
jgi:dihydrofolate synthase/folylpolyglutamate synthase